MVKILFILFLLISNSSYGQIDTAIINNFEWLNYSPDYLNLKYDSLDTKIDSAEVKIKHNPNVTIADNYFIQSKRLLIIKFYFKEGSLFFITTSETCPSKPNLTCETRYYIVANKIIQQDHLSSKVISLGIPLSLKEIQEQHYCPDRFDYDFLENYVWILFQKIKENFP